jgi:DHA1 family tetracycline resistance protein-like MFS transporter
LLAGRRTAPGQELGGRELSKKPLVIVFMIVFIDLMGFGIVIPLLPLYADRYHPSPAVFGLLMAAYSLMQFVFTPVLGRLSDRFGRRPILLLSLAGTVCGYVLFGLQHSLLLLFLSRIVGGLMGANVATAQAVIADITKPQERAKGMGLIGAAFGLGFIFGPAIGGATVRLGEAAPGLFAAGLSLTALVVAALFLPETWPRERRTMPKPVRRGWFSLNRLAVALRHPQIGLLLVIYLLATFAFANFESTFALTLEKRLNLDASHVMWLFVFVGVLAAVIQGGLIGRLVKRYGERRLIFAGALFLVPGYFLLPLAHSVPALILVLPLLALGAGLTNPSLSSLVSRLATADEQGGILGVYQSMASMARILGPFWGVFAFERFGMNSPYWTAAGVAAVVAGLAGIVLVRARNAALSGHALENGSAA